MKKIKLQKSKRELHLQEFKSLVKEFMHTDNDKNETDLEKEYEGSESVSDTAMVTLMEITKKKSEIEQLEQLKIEQLEKEEKLHLEKIE